MTPYSDPPPRPAAPLTSDHKYVRKVRGRKWQARPWVGGIGHVNLGLYDTDAEAAAAVRAFVRDGRTRPGLLPKWVKPAAAGGFLAEYRPAPGRVVRLGPFLTPLPAHAAMRAYLLAHRAPTAERRRAARRHARLAREALTPGAPPCPGP